MKESSFLQTGPVQEDEEETVTFKRASDLLVIVDLFFNIFILTLVMYCIYKMEMQDIVSCSFVA